MATPSGSDATCSKPNISCHAPLKPNYMDCETRIVRWASLDLRYKKPPKPLRIATRTKKKPSKHKRESGKSSGQESKPESGVANASTPAPTEASTSTADESSAVSLDQSGCHINVLPQCCLLRIFSYLPICDLLMTGLACKAWQQLSLDRSIWKSVSLEDANILSWTRAAKTLQYHGTIALDFYNIANEGRTSWKNMYSIVKKLPGLQYLRFGYAHSTLISKVTQHLTELRVLEVCWLLDEHARSLESCVTFDLGKLSKLTQLRELKIRSINSLFQPAMSFSGGLSSLENLQHLQKLSLTSLQESRISPFEYKFLNKLPELVELELGDCGNWGSETYDNLSQLTKLSSLRLENGGCWCGGDYALPCTCNIAESLKKLTRLEKLELIMYTMPSDINPSLQSLLRLQTLTYWPMVSLRGHLVGPYATGCESPLIQTNSDKCKTLGNLQHLRHLTWGVPIITFDSPQKEYPFNVTTEKAIKSQKVLELTAMLAKQLPETAVNVLIVPVVMSKHQYDHGYLDSSDDDSSCWDSDSDYWDSDDSDSEDGHDGDLLHFGYPYGY